MKKMLLFVALCLLVVGCATSKEHPMNKAAEGVQRTTKQVAEGVRAVSEKVEEAVWDGM